MIRLALLPLAFIVSAATPAAPSDDLTAINAKAVVGPLTIRPLAVVEDSRCPSGVMCVWAGRVLLRIAIEGPGVSRTLTLENGKPFVIAGGALTLTQIEPPRVRGKPMAPYRFGFVFKRDGKPSAP